MKIITGRLHILFTTAEAVYRDFTLIKWYHWLEVHGKTLLFSWPVPEYSGTLRREPWSRVHCLYLRMFSLLNANWIAGLLVAWWCKCDMQPLFCLPKKERTAVHMHRSVCVLCTLYFTAIPGLRCLPTLVTKLCRNNARVFLLSFVCRFSIIYATVCLFIHMADNLYGWSKNKHAQFLWGTMWCTKWQ